MMPKFFARRLFLQFFISAIVLFAVSAIAVHVLAQAPAPGSPQDVITYHGDKGRTGWFSAETQLNAGNVNAQTFGLLQTVVVDERVDAEPLVVMHQMIQGQGYHDVVYVATENNSVYAIDAESGAILWQVNFGTAVPYQYKNYDDNVYPVMGILGTPVINRNNNVMYVVADTYNGTVDVFTLHAISLSTGADLLTPAPIQFSENIQSGTWTFNPQFQLQRPGLLLANGNVYVAFGSNGDIVPGSSRGVILGYNATTLKQIKGQVTDRLYLQVNPYYLSSVWQSGYGVAADTNGDVYFSTGNSDPYTPSYFQSFNRPDSVLRIAGDLSKLKSSFTPYDYFTLDEGDVDLGSGGTMVLPDQPGQYPHLAVAGGKDGREFLLNRDKLGGYTNGGPDNVLQSVSMGGCWCGPAFFVGSDGIPRVVTGGGNGVTNWQLQTSPATQLVYDSTTGSGPADGLPDYGGTIPVVSSNGNAAGSGVVWFVQKPATSNDNDPGTPVTLWAFSAADLSQELFTSQAGTWRHAVNSNANIVPTVANGRVYVASNKQLQIFGLLQDRRDVKLPIVAPPVPSAPAVVACAPSESPRAAVSGGAEAEHQFHGNVCRVHGGELRVNLRGGHSIAVNISHAFDNHRRMTLAPGRPVTVRATIDSQGAAHALRVSPSHIISPITPPDR